MIKVEGKNRQHQVMLFALSTCMWCRKTKKLLQDNSVEYEYVNVDELRGTERDAAVEEVKKHNPNCTFPTTVVDGKCIVGYRETELKETLGL